MSIADELRKYASDATTRKDYMAGLAFDLSRIADRIDAAYQKAEDEWKAKDGQTWLRGYGECHAELMEGNEVIAADLERAGWMRLPKDADGEYIHVGDVMDELDARCPGTPTTFTVADMFYQGNDRWHLRAYPATYDPKTCRHHHAPTVEDVLKEFAFDVLPATCMADHEVTDAIERFALMLRLAGDAE